METYIKAIEFMLPQKIVTNEQLIKRFPEWNAEKVSDKTGIIERHVVAEGETASDLAFEAAQKLFEKDPLIKDEIDFILFCTQSPDYKLPTSACLLQKRLGLNRNIGALDYNLGCSGYIYGLALAKGLISSGIAKNVLLLTAETYSIYFHPKDKGNMSIFGDGAAATVVSSKGFANIGEFCLGTDGSGADNLIVKTGGARYPNPLGLDGKDKDGYIISSDHLYMSGPNIFNFTLDVVPELIDHCLHKNGLKMGDINMFIPHQANKYMLNTLRKVCGINKDKFYIDLTHTGNTVSSTLPIAIKGALEKKAIKQDDIVLITGFGVGYSYGACILRF